MAYMFAGLFMLIIIGIALAIYLVSAFALMTIAQRRNIENPWLAFIPVANLYLMGLIIGPFKIFDFEVEKPELVLPAAALIAAVLGAIPLIGGLITLANYGLIVYAFYRLYLMYKPESAVLYTIVGALIPVAIPFFLFSIRNNDPIA